MKNELEFLRLQENDLDLFIELVELMNDVFEDHQTIASKNNLINLLIKPTFYAIAVTMNKGVIGGLTAYELQRYYNDKSELYIYDMAVKTKLHNQGIGKKLINYLKEYSTKIGMETIFVEAHSEDKQAVKFYESTFGKSEKVDHFNFNLNTTHNNVYCI